MAARKGQLAGQAVPGGGLQPFLSAAVVASQYEKNSEPMEKMHDDDFWAQGTDVTEHDRLLVGSKPQMFFGSRHRRCGQAIRCKQVLRGNTIQYLVF